MLNSKLRNSILLNSILRECKEHRNTTHQVKAIAIGIFAADLWLKSVDCCDVCVYLYVFFPKKRENRYKELFPNTHLYMGSYSRLFRYIGITFNKVTF